ncbi:hypothetical protein [Candidatus Spongiihabitans sp.]
MTENSTKNPTSHNTQFYNQDAFMKFDERDLLTHASKRVGEKGARKDG